MEINLNEPHDSKMPGEEDEISDEVLKHEQDAPIEEKIKSNYPKVRKTAYEELLSGICDNQASYSFLAVQCHKFLEDSCPLSMESALDLLIKIYESNHELSNEINIEEVITLTIEKAYATSKTACRNKCKELLCIIVQRGSFLEKFLDVVKSILSYPVAKKAKVIIFCEQILLHILSEFGASEINYEYLIKTIISLVDGSNHGIKSEAMSIVKTIYKWERDGMKMYLSTLKESVIKDLNKEFAKIEENEPSRPIPRRAIVGKVQMISANQNISKDEYFTTPVPLKGSTIRPSNENILLHELFPDHWVDRLLAKDRKWIEKRDMLEDFTQTILTNRISDAKEPHDLLFTSFKALLKDTNITVVQCTLNAICALSQQMGANFSFTSNMKECIPLIFEKYKEKKEKVNKDIMATLSALLKFNITLDEIVPYLVAVPSDKSYQYKMNICEFVLITLRKTYKNILKKVGNELLEFFGKLSDEQNQDIRNSALNGLAILKVRLGESFKCWDDFPEAKKIKIEDAAKGVSYDKAYDVEEDKEMQAIRTGISDPKKMANKGESDSSPTEIISVKGINTTNEAITPFQEITDTSKPNESELSKNNNEEIPLNKVKPHSENINANDNEEQIYKKDQQADLEEFERKLEEAMRKEEVKQQNSQMIIEMPGKKAVSKRNPTTNENNKTQEEEINDKINLIIGDETANLLQSTKWEEKKQGFIQLNEWLKVDRNNLTNNVDNFITFTKIKLKDFKETNFNVLREACNVYTTCLANYNGKGFEKKHASLIIKGLYEKLGDSKLKEVLTNLLYALMESIGPKYIITSVLSILNNEKSKPSVNVLKEYATFFEKAIEDFGIGLVPVKEMVELCKLMAGHTNPQVRASSTSLLCMLYKYIGKDIKTLIKDIKESTLKIIEAEFEKVTVIEPSASSTMQPKRELKETALQEEGLLANKQIQPDLIPRTDISRKITQKMLKDIIGGKWPEKKEACEAIEKILKDANMKILPTGLNELFTTIKGRLGDGNKNLVRMMVSLLSKLIEAVGVGFKPYCKALSGPLIGNLADKMQMLREDVLICMDKWVDNVGLDMIIIYLPAFLKQDNFDMRTELLKFLNKYKETFNNHRAFIEITLKEFISPFLICLQDKALSIRASAEELIAYSLRFIPLNLYMNGLKDFKPAIANTLKLVLEKFMEDTTGTGVTELTMTVSNNSTVLKSDKSSPDIKKVEKSPAKRDEKDLQGCKAALQKSDNVNQNKTTKKNKMLSDDNVINTLNNKTGTGQNIKKEDVDHLLSSNSTILKSNIKGVSNPGTSISQPISPRIFSKKISTTIFLPNITIKPPTKEKRLEIDKKYKFSLETLNEDFALKLKEQLKSIFTSEFLAKMLNDEIKYIIDSMTSIFTGIKEEEKCPLTFNTIFENLDVILKWIGWKLNNNQNPVLIKILLEILEVLYDKLLEKDLKLNETEGYIIISLLIDKLGSNNSKIKDNVRTLIDKYLEIISANKAFQSFVNSLSSKNSKIKAECIDICRNLISSDGVDIASAKDLRYIAKFLTSNDNVIKASTISLLQEVYVQMRDNLWNILSDTPEKIKEMLFNKFNEEAANFNDDDDKKELEEKVNSEKTKIDSLKCGLAPAIEGKAKASLSSECLIKVEKPEGQDSSRTGSKSHHNLLTTSNPQGSSEPCGSSWSSLSHQNELIFILNNLSSTEVSEKVNMIIIIHELICTKFEESKNILIPNVDLIIRAFIAELKKLFENKNLSEIPIKLGKYLITVLCKISSNKELIRNISPQALFELSEEVLSNLLIENLDKVGENQEGVIIFKSLNSTMLRVLENCSSTDVISALLDIIKIYRTSEDKGKLAGLAVKCLLKMNQILGQIIDSVEVDKILLRIHILLAEYEEVQPNLSVSTQTDQMVVRYVKNLVSELVKLKKEAIIEDYVKGVESHPVKDKYLKRWIKNLLSTLSIGQGGMSSSPSSGIGLLQDTSPEAFPKINMDDMLTYKNQLQQSKDNTQLKSCERVLNKNASSSSSNSLSTSPNKIPKNTEMYNKIINLKSKLASFNNATNSKGNNVIICEEKSSPPICNSRDHIAEQSNNLASVQPAGKSFMSTINELKRKWNDVSNKSKTNAISPGLSPVQGSKANPNVVNINVSNNDMTDSNMNRLNEIKNKFARIKK